jgi:hypothetical protein
MILYFQINNNGHLSFDFEVPVYQPTLVMPSDYKLIAVFLADVDTSSAGSVYYRYASLHLVLTRAKGLHGSGQKNIRCRKHILLKCKVMLPRKMFSDINQAFYPFFCPFSKDWQNAILLCFALSFDFTGRIIKMFNIVLGKDFIIRLLQIMNLAICFVVCCSGVTVKRLISVLCDI